MRLRLFGRCRIYHDPVSPVMKRPAAIGWAALYRDIDLVTDRQLRGEELAWRTKGWWTVDPGPVIEVVNRHGRLALGEGGELMVELETQTGAEQLASDLESAFGDQILLRP